MLSQQRSGILQGFLQLLFILLRWSKVQCSSNDRNLLLLIFNKATYAYVSELLLLAGIDFFE